jgi:hypothetical protein
MLLPDLLMDILLKEDEGGKLLLIMLKCFKFLFSLCPLVLDLKRSYESSNVSSGCIISGCSGCFSKLFSWVFIENVA